MRVFLSSTGLDLVTHREAAIAAIQSSQCFECDAMEDWGARDSGVAEFDEVRLSACDLVIFLIGHRFGSSPPDRERKRQKTFREHVRRTGNRIVAEFRNSAELAEKITLSIRNWHDDRRLRARSRDVLARAPQINRGALVQKLCNRHRQEERFFDFLCDARERNGAVPLMCVIPGPEGECHGSLVERFADTLSRIVGDGKSKARVPSKPVPWQYTGQLEPRFRRLIGKLVATFENAAPLTAITEPTAQQFRASFRGLPDSLAVVQHHISAGMWDVCTTRLLVYYRRFWDVGSDPSLIPVIVFVNVVYPRLRADSGRTSIAHIVRRIRALSIGAQLRFAAWRAGCPCLVLDELTPIRRQDLDEWMVNNRIFDTEQERIDALDQVFPPDGDESRVMAYVEQHCGMLLHNYPAEDSEEEAKDEPYAGELIHH